MKNLKFHKDQKVDNKVEAGPPLHGKIAEIIKTCFNSRISKTALKDTKLSLYFLRLNSK